MLTLIHAPQSRSSSVIQLLDELGALDQVEVRTVMIHRLRSGTGKADPANPHPEGKVPLLIHDGVAIRERNAIMLYLTELFPAAGMGVPPGDPQRGVYLAWLAYYGNVMEPVFIGQFARIDHPAYHSVFRGVDEVTATLTAALQTGPWLMGNRFTAVDLLISGVFAWAPESVPDVPLIRDWIARCQARPSVARTLAFDAAEPVV
ncbi:MAG: glutathione S-transferase family protein [Tabrizicola sp.]|jgi:glutathione S-transferase|nr:glutathione S-transferase family protein [Tabrizicola sp.]